MIPISIRSEDLGEERFRRGSEGLSFVRKFNVITNPMLLRKASAKTSLVLVPPRLLTEITVSLTSEIMTLSSKSAIVAVVVVVAVV